MITRPTTLLSGCGLFLALATLTHAGQPLETETARLLKAGEIQIEAAFEFQTSSQGEADGREIIGMRYTVSKSFSHHTA